MDIWFENHTKVKVRPSSHQTYRGYINNHIKPHFGSLDLQKFYKKLLSSGRVERIESRKQSKGLSPKTVRNFHQIIASAMELAREQKRSSPTRLKAAYCSRSSTKRQKTLPVEQLASFLRGLRKVEYSCSTMWSWSPACAGELLGLQ